MEIKILSLEEKDIEKILPFYKKWFELFTEYSPKTIEYFVKESEEKDLLKKINNGWTILVAYISDQPVGVLLAGKPYGGVIYCDTLVVDEKYQRKGIGTKLLAEFEKTSKIKGVHSIRIEAEQRDLEFYKKCGFEIIGLDKKGCWGTDNYILKKIIQEPKEENFLK